MHSSLLWMTLTGCAPAHDTALPEPAARVVINEVRAKDGDPIELLNTGAAAADLSGWSVTDEHWTPDHTYTFPDGATLAPGAYLVLEKGTHHAFGLGDEDAVALRDADGVLIDEVSWGDGAADVSYCRLPDGDGPFHSCTPATVGQENLIAGALPQPIWIAGGAQGDAEGEAFDEPNELGFDHDGRLWAGDVYNLRVQVFDAEGALVGVVGGEGDAPGHFARPDDDRKYGPEAIRADPDNQIFIVDRGGRRINVYDGTTMAFARAIESEHFQDPTGLAIDARGDLYVADQGSDTIIKLSNDGAYQFHFDATDSDGASILQKTETLALVEADDLLLATSEDEARVEVFQRATGAWLGRGIGAPQAGDVPEHGRHGDDIEGIAVDPVRQRLFTSDEDNGRILIFDLDAGEALYDAADDFGFSGAFGAVGDAPGQLRSADGIAVDAERGRIAVADQGNFRIQVFAIEDIEAYLTVP